MGRLFPPPQFGVPLSTEEMGNELPFEAIYGITPSNKYIPISVDSQGRLNTLATFSGSITIGEIGITDESPFTYGVSLQQSIGGVYQDVDPTLSPGQQGAVRLTEYRAFHTNLRTSAGVEITSTTSGPKQALDVNLINNISSGQVDISPFVYGTSLFQPIGAVYQDTDPTLPEGETGAVRMTQYRALQVNLRDSSGDEIFPATEATSLSILADLNQFQFDGTGALIVTGGSTPVVTGVPVNVFAENSTVPSGVLTTIVTYTVPVSQIFEISGIVAWGTYDGEFTISVDGTPVGGGWCSPSDRTLELDYDSATVTANAGQVVTVQVTHYSATTEDFKANLLGNLYSIVPSSIWGIPVNVYDDVTSIPPGVETNVITYTVPATKTLSILGMYCWGNYDGEFTIRVNGVQVGGGWSSPSDRTLFVDFSSAPVGASAGLVVTINVTQYGTASYDFQANLLGGLK
jgi:hypothetical protein